MERSNQQSNQKKIITKEQIKKLENDFNYRIFDILEEFHEFDNEKLEHELEQNKMKYLKFLEEVEIYNWDLEDIKKAFNLSMKVIINVQNKR